MFAILLKALPIEIQEEISHFAGWEGGGVMGTKLVNKMFVNKLAFHRKKRSKSGKHEVRTSRRLS